MFGGFLLKEKKTYNKTFLDAANVFTSNINVQ